MYAYQRGACDNNIYDIKVLTCTSCLSSSQNFQQSWLQSDLQRGLGRLQGNLKTIVLLWSQEALTVSIRVYMYAVLFRDGQMHPPPGWGHWQPCNAVSSPWTTVSICTCENVFHNYHSLVHRAHVVVNQPLLLS